MARETDAGVRPGKQLFLDKNNCVLYMFSLGILTRAWLSGRAAKKGPRLFESGKVGSTQPTREGRSEEESFFTPNARNSLKKLDSEK
jgi:hypothetical protein